MVSLKKGRVGIRVDSANRNSPRNELGVLVPALEPTGTRASRKTNVGTVLEHTLNSPVASRRMGSRDVGEQKSAQALYRRFFTKLKLTLGPDAYGRKSKQESVDDSSQLGAILDGRYMPRPTINRRALIRVAVRCGISLRIMRSPPLMWAGELEFECRLLSRYTQLEPDLRLRRPKDFSWTFSTYT